MKVNLYLDIQEGFGVPQHGFNAHSNIGPASDGYKRIKLTVDVPDYVLFGKVDLEIPLEKTEVLK